MVKCYIILLPIKHSDTYTFVCTANTQSSGMSECSFFYPTTNASISVTTGTVCIGCVIDNELATNVTFEIANSTEFEPDGILTVIEAEHLFHTNIGTLVQCSSGNKTANVTVFLERKFKILNVF